MTQATIPMQVSPVARTPRRLRPTRGTVVVTAIALVVVLTLSTLTYLLMTTRGRLDRTTRTLSATQADLSRTSGELRTTQDKLTTATKQLDETKSELSATQSELSDTKAALETAKGDAQNAKTLGAKAVRVASTLHTCLKGMIDVAQAALDENYSTINSVLTPGFITDCRQANTDLDDLLSTDNSDSV